MSAFLVWSATHRYRRAVQALRHENSAAAPGGRVRSPKPSTCCKPARSPD